MGIAGKRVLITRAADDAAELQSRLTAVDAVPVLLPTLVRAPPDDPDVLLMAATALHDADGLAIGSLAALRPLIPHIDRPCGAVVGCVGEKTAERLNADPALASKLVGPRVVPPVFRAEALVAALHRHFEGQLEGRRFVVPRAEEGRPTLVAGLRDAGASVVDVITYRIRPAPRPTAGQWADVQTIDVALFLSGETLANFLRITPEDEARRLLARAVVGVIGPVARSRADDLGIRVDVVPTTATQDALIDAVDRHLVLSAPGRS